MGKRHELDRSTMNANLSTISADFGALPTKHAERMVSSALQAWYEDSTSTDMFMFALNWVRKSTNMFPRAQYAHR